MNERLPKKDRINNWSDAIRDELEAKGTQIFGWKVLGEGAIAASIKTGPDCKGGAAIYLFQVVPEEIEGLFSDNPSDLFPNLIQYHDDFHYKVDMTPEEAIEQLEYAEQILKSYLASKHDSDKKLWRETTS